MKISEVQELLQSMDTVDFILPNGKMVPRHYHVTEIGLVDKRFIDCGGTIRKESVISFQLWDADDHDHRLRAKKLSSIIELSRRKLQLDNLEVEVEYQSDTIGRYRLEFDGARFHLVGKHTDCLAREVCTPSLSSTDLATELTAKTSCAPEVGCC